MRMQEFQGQKTTEKNSTQSESLVLTLSTVDRLQC